MSVLVLGVLGHLDGYILRSKERGVKGGSKTISSFKLESSALTKTRISDLQAVFQPSVSAFTRFARLNIGIELRK